MKAKKMKKKSIPRHLSYWEEGVDVETFKKWCGDHNVPFKKECRDHVRKQQYKSLLDVGAGLFSEYFGFKEDNYKLDYTATEITPQYIKYGKDLGLKVVEADCNEMPFDDNQFDCCYCFNVLNHNLCYKQSIKEMLRVSKKEVIISFFKGFEEELTPEYLEQHKNNSYFVECEYAMAIGDAATGPLKVHETTSFTCGDPPTVFEPPLIRDKFNEQLSHGQLGKKVFVFIKAENSHFNKVEVTDEIRATSALAGLGNDAEFHPYANKDIRFSFKIKEKRKLKSYLKTENGLIFYKYDSLGQSYCLYNHYNLSKMTSFLHALPKVEWKMIQAEDGTTIMILKKT